MLNDTSCSNSPGSSGSGANETRQRVTGSSKDYRNKAPVQKHMARHGLLQHDSGNEESDSLHSLYHCNITLPFPFHPDSKLCHCCRVF